MNNLFRQVEEGEGEAWIHCHENDDSSVSSIDFSDEDSVSSSDGDSGSWNALKVEELRKSLTLKVKNNLKSNPVNSQLRTAMSGNSLSGSNQSLMSRWDDSLESNTYLSKKNEQWSVNAIQVSNQLKRLPTGRQTTRRKPLSRGTHGSTPNLISFPSSPVTNPLGFRRTGTGTLLGCPVRIGSNPELPTLQRQKSASFLERANGNTRTSRRLRNKLSAAAAAEDILGLKRPVRNSKGPEAAEENNTSNTLQKLGLVVVTTASSRSNSKPDLSKTIAAADPVTATARHKRVPSRVLDLSNHSNKPVSSRAKDLSSNLPKTGSHGDLRIQTPQREGSLPRLNDSSSSLNRLARSSESQGRTATGFRRNGSGRMLQRDLSPRGLAKTLPKDGHINRLNNSSNSLNRLARGNEIVRNTSSPKLGEATQARIYKSLSGSSLGLLKDTHNSLVPKNQGWEPSPENDAAPSQRPKKLFEKFTSDMHSFLVQSNASAQNLNNSIAA